MCKFILEFLSYIKKKKFINKYHEVVLDFDIKFKFVSFDKVELDFRYEDLLDPCCVLDLGYGSNKY